MGATAIRVTEISKEYMIDYSHTNSFKELVMRKLFPGSQNNIKSRKNILALDNLSFEVKKGEVLGIIGKNGAGKSTLLKVLSGITRPTSGKIEIFGRMSSILDIGIGFHPELTGRENIYLSGELNGLNRKEIRKRMGEIIDFSGVEEFIDTPVKYYSSGMFLRLAFSVFTGIDSDILLLDEVMSVGDAEFQLKSSRKLQSMFGQGKTVILVSHIPADIVKLCTRAIVLEDGKIVEEGIPGKIISEYMEGTILNSIDIPKEQTTDKTNKTKEEAQNTLETVETLQEEPLKTRSMVFWDNLSTAPGNDYFRLTGVQIRSENSVPGEIMYIDERLILEIFYWKKNESDIIDVGFFLYHFGNMILASNSILEEPSISLHSNSGRFCAKTWIPENLLNDTVYSLDIQFIKDKSELLLNLTDVIYFKMNQSKDPLPVSLKKYINEFPGSIRLSLKWEINNADN